MPTVFIFENAPSQGFLHIGNGKIGSTMEAAIAFTDSCGQPQFYSPSLMGYDTLVVFTDRDYIELTHLHKALNKLYFYIKSGDTVLFSYDSNQYPFLKSYTSEALTRQYNFTTNLSGRLSCFGIEPLSIFITDGFWNVYKGVNQAIKENRSIPKEVFSLYIPMDTVWQQTESYLQEYADLLEKQYNAKELSPGFYHYYSYLLQNKKLSYQRILLQYTANPSERTLAELNKIYNNYFDDKYCYYMSYLQSLEEYLHAYESIGFPNITVNKGSFGGGYYDYRAVFDSISIRPDIPSKTRSYMLYKLLDNIIAHSSVEDIERYKEKYIQQTGDSISAKNKLLERGIIETKNEDLQLRDEKGNEISFENLRKQWQGKVIYVDFWASWCAPCRSGMPDALTLRKEYEGKDVVFLYLAHNDREDTWKEAISKLQLNDRRAVNYFITNSKSSKAIQELKIESIPRYIIYDKTGKIAYYRAPGAHGAEVRKALDELLR